MLKESAEPISGTEEYGTGGNGWRRRLGRSGKWNRMPATVVSQGKSGTRSTATKRRPAPGPTGVRTRRWRTRKPASAVHAGHDRLMERIEGLGPDCPAVLADALSGSRVLERSIDRLHVVREDLQRLAGTDVEIEHGDDAVRLTVGEARHLLADEGVERAFLRHHPEIRREMTHACDRIQERLDTGERVRTMPGDWQALQAEAAKAGLHPFLMPGYGPLMEQIQDHRGRLPEELARAKREHPVFEKANRRTERLADTVCSCRDRRQELLDMAAESPGSDEAFNRTGRKYRSWKRQAGRALKAGTELLDGPEPPLLHPTRRQEVATALGRIRKAAVLDGLPPRFIQDWEAFSDRAEAAVATGSSSPATRISATGWTNSSRKMPRPDCSKTMKSRPAGRCAAGGTSWKVRTGRAPVS